MIKNETKPETDFTTCKSIEDSVRLTTVRREEIIGVELFRNKYPINNRFIVIAKLKSKKLWYIMYIKNENMLERSVRPT
jgi:hypothetical protein